MKATHVALFLCGAILSVTLFSGQTEGALAGIDFGGEWIKIAILKPGTGFTIATNEQAKRKTPNFVGFHRGERQLGDSAYQLVSKVPKTMFSNLRSYLGKPAEAARQADLFAPYNIDENASSTGGVVFRVDSETSYTVEELVAMQLDYARDIAAKFAQVPIKDVVITIPPYFGQAERQSLLDAARIAGLNVMAVVIDTTAAAIHHGVYRPTDAEDEHLIIYDLGATSLGVTLVHLENKVTSANKTVGHLTVKAHAWDSTLGGNSFDQRLALHFAQMFNEQHNSDIQSSPRAMKKLLGEARKIKEVLSANQAVPLFMESVHEDYDLKLTVTREEFESICEDLFNRALIPVSKVLADSGLDASNVSVIELFGGGSRVPKVQAKLESLGIPIGKHLNTDEAAVLGATFVAGSLSSSFRVKDYQYRDGLSDGIGFSYPTEDGTKNDRNLFPKGTKTDSKKVIAFPLNRDFAIDVFLNKTEETKEELLHITVDGVNALAEKYPQASSIKVNVGFQLYHGVLNITKAEGIIEDTVEVEEPIAPTPTAAKKDDSDASNKKPSTTNEEEKKKEEDSDATPDEKNQETEADKEKEKDNEEKSNQPEAEKSTTEAEAPKTVKKLKKRTHKATLPFTVSHKATKPTTVEGIQASRKVLEALDEKDQERARDAEARDTLERFIYQIKEKLVEEENHRFILEQERVSLGEQFDEAESWLYDEGATAQAAASRKKLGELKSATQEWTLRISEAEERPRAIAEARVSINSTRELVRQQVALGRNITQEELDAFGQDLLEFETWLNETIAKQDALQPHEGLVLRSAHIKYRREDIEKTAAALMRKPMKQKPKPKKEEKKKEEKKDEEKKDEEKKDEEKKDEEKKDEEKKDEEKKEEEGKKVDNEKEEAKKDDEGEAAKEEQKHDEL